MTARKHDRPHKGGTCVWSFILILLCSPIHESQATDLGHWMIGEPAPTARTEVAVAAVDGSIYVVGGFEPPSLWSMWRSSVSTKVEVYDPTTNRWSSRAGLPVGLHHAGAAVVEGHVYIVGGFTRDKGTIWNPSDRVFRLNPATNMWEERAPLPTARGALAVTTLQGKLFAISGYDGEDNPAAVEVYDPSLDQWTAAAPLPTPRDHLAAVTIGGTVYAIGGRVRLNYRDNLSTVEAYDADRNRWIPKAGMPTPRSGIAAAVVHEWVYVFGGESGEGTFHQNERFHSRLNRWEAMAPMPTARHGLGAAEVDGHVYVLSGGPRPGGSYSRHNEIFIPPSARPRQSGRTPAAHVGSVMAILATFDEAGVLPPESSPQANQLIRALIQFQSAFLKSSEAAVREFLASALQAHSREPAQARLDRFALTGWTSESLEAVVDYSMQHPMWGNPRLAHAFRAYNLHAQDWALVQEVFLQARRNLAGRKHDLHAVFAGHRAGMPGGRF